MNPTSVRLEDIFPFVPHRPPMVWIDRLVAFSETAGVCEVVIKEHGHYMGPEGLRATSGLEFIAQAYGYCSTAYKRSVNPDTPPLKRAFFAGFKNARFASSARLKTVRIGDLITVRFDQVRHIGSITVLEGQALHAGEIICEAQLKVFCES